MNDPRSPAFVAPAGDVAARVAATIRSEIRALNVYPVAKAEGMIKLDAMENPYALPDDVALIAGNGSDEILQIITTAVTKPGAAIVAPDPSFVMYRLYAVYANARYVA